MPTVYKIHPAVGVARVGNHGTAFFIGPEVPGSPGVEIGADGAETTLSAYKQDGRVKRQAARFRVFAYERDATGSDQLVGEVGPDVQVQWTVDLVNRKAALARSFDPAEPRNPGVTDRDSLVIRNPQPASVAGPAQAPVAVQGKFLGTDVYLGEIRTDAAGRLVVLGGRGTSASVPPGVPLASFANNDGWHDDVSDGPVTATVTAPGGEPVPAEPAWVVVAPPDFAPTVDATVSLYDIGFQAAIDAGMLAPESVPSFTRHIRPMIERTAGLRWVDSWEEWNDLQPIDWATLADIGPAAAPAREQMAERVRQPGLADFNLPKFLAGYLELWAAGTFVSDLGQPPPAEPVPAQLDRAALERASGNNFYPGIEGGRNLMDATMYAAPFRFDRGNPDKVFPGCVTEIMALPWQADFLACDGGVWWPTQRPDQVMTDPADIPGSVADWETPIEAYEGMVADVMRLGFVVPRPAGDGTVLVEVERDPEFPRPQ